MSANLKTVAHYQAFEQHARDVDKARTTINELRTELHSVLLDIQRICADYGHELHQYDDLITRAHKTLLRTLPGGEFDASLPAAFLVENPSPTGAGREALDLDAMSKPKRKDTLFDVISNICLPPIHRSNCDACNERPWTHRTDYCGIETYVCDECSSS